jgi:hypothetical protein
MVLGVRASASAACQAQPQSVPDRCHPDRDEHSGQLDTELGHVTGRRVGREPAPVLLIQASEIGRVSEQYADLDDILQAGAAGLENSLAVRQRLPGLCLDGVSRRAASSARFPS